MDMGKALGICREEMTEDGESIVQQIQGGKAGG
jgi:hypothetical protein